MLPLFPLDALHCKINIPVDHSVLFSITVEMALKRANGCMVYCARMVNALTATLFSAAFNPVFYLLHTG